MKTEIIETPDTAEDSVGAHLYVLEAKALAVVDQASYDAGGALLSHGARLKAAVIAKLKKSRDAAWSAHKEALALENDLIAPYDDGRKDLQPRMIAWASAEKIRREAESRAAAEAAQRAAEAIRAVEAARAEAERKAAKDRAVAEAAAAEDSGDVEAANAILRAGEAEAAAAESQRLAVLAAPVYVAPLAVEKVKTQGVAIPERWVAEVRDLLALIQYVAANPIYISCLAPVQSVLNAHAKSMNIHLPIKGVVAVKVASMSIRS